VQALQQQLEAQIGEGAASTAGGNGAQLETELRALQEQVSKLESEGGGTGTGAAPGKGKGTSESVPSGGSGTASKGTSEERGNLLQQAQEASEAGRGK